MISVSRHIDAPREVVFDLCSDFERAAERIRGIERVEMLTDGPVGVGTRFRETRIMFKKEATEEMEVTQFDAPESYTLHARNCGCIYTSRLLFHPDGSGTRVEMTFDARPVTLLAKVMSPIGKLMTGPLRKCIEQDLDDLKSVAEGRGEVALT